MSDRGTIDYAGFRADLKDISQNDYPPLQLVKLPLNWYTPTGGVLQSKTAQVANDTLLIVSINVTAGNRIVLVVGGGSGPFTITDGAGNTYTDVMNNGVNEYQIVYLSSVVSGGVVNIQSTQLTAGPMSLAAIEVQGILQVDQQSPWISDPGVGRTLTGCQPGALVMTFGQCTNPTIPIAADLVGFEESDAWTKQAFIGGTDGNSLQVSSMFAPESGTVSNEVTGIYAGPTPAPSDGYIGFVSFNGTFNDSSVYGIVEIANDTGLDFTFVSPLKNEVTGTIKSVTIASVKVDTFDFYIMTGTLPAMNVQQVFSIPVQPGQNTYVAGVDFPDGIVFNEGESIALWGNDSSNTFFFTSDPDPLSVGFFLPGPAPNSGPVNFTAGSSPGYLPAWQFVLERAASTAENLVSPVTSVSLRGPASFIRAVSEGIDEQGDYIRTPTYQGSYPSGWVRLNGSLAPWVPFSYVNSLARAYANSNDIYDGNPIAAGGYNGIEGPFNQLDWQPKDRIPYAGPTPPNTPAGFVLALVGTMLGSTSDFGQGRGSTFAIPTAAGALKRAEDEL